MIADALKYLAELARGPQTPVPLEAGVRGQKTYAIGGQIVNLTSSPPLRALEIETLESFAAAVLAWRASLYSVWVFADENTSSIKAIGVLDESPASHRADRANLSLTWSEPFNAVRDLGRPLSQRALIELLRGPLHGCAPESLLPAVRRVAAASNAGVASEITQGRERGTREFQAALVNAESFPEFVTLNMPVAPPLAYEAVITCSLAITLPPADISFVLAPLPGEIDRELRAAVATLASEIDALLGPASASQAAATKARENVPASGARRPFMNPIFLGRP